MNNNALARLDAFNRALIGFDTMFERLIRSASLPVEIGSIIKPKDPLFTVSRGALFAAEAAGNL